MSLGNLKIFDLGRSQTATVDSKIIPFVKNRFRSIIFIALSVLLVASPLFANDAVLPSDASNVQSRVKRDIMSIVPTPTGDGFWQLSWTGEVFPYGDATGFGGPKGNLKSTPYMDMASTESGNGYWVLGYDGGVFIYGDAQYFGDARGLRGRSQTVAIKPTPSGNGYWILTDTGFVFPFGDAAHFGDARSHVRSKPIVDFEITPDGNGYWLAGTDGSVLIYGNAQYFGNARQNASGIPITGFASNPSGNGYWMLSRDGTVYPYGAVTTYGTIGNYCLSGNTPDISPGKTTGYFTTTVEGIPKAYSPSSVVTCIPKVPTGIAAIEADLLTRANAERAARGLPALRLDSGLRTSARNWSSSMSRSNSFNHSNLYPLLGRFQTAAENIGLAGAGTKSGAIHVAWMRSTGHRVNLLARNLEVIGIGAYCAPDGRLWVTQQFGRFPGSSIPSTFGPTPAENPIVKSDATGPTC